MPTISDTLTATNHGPGPAETDLATVGQAIKTLQTAAKLKKGIPIPDPQAEFINKLLLDLGLPNTK